MSTLQLWDSSTPCWNDAIKGGLCFKCPKSLCPVFSKEDPKSTKEEKIMLKPVIRSVVNRKTLLSTKPRCPLSHFFLECQRSLLGGMIFQIHFLAILDDHREIGMILQHADIRRWVLR
jgi:hypothetical protein